MKLKLTDQMRPHYTETFRFKTKEQIEKILKDKGVLKAWAFGETTSDPQRPVMDALEDNGQAIWAGMLTLGDSDDLLETLLIIEMS